MNQAVPPDDPTPPSAPESPARNCPDCGAPNPEGATLCVECNHPLDVPDSRAEPLPPAATTSAPAPAAEPAASPRRRIERPERPERVGPNVTSWGYTPARASSGGPPSWLWAGVGLAGLAAVLVTAVQIARQPPPIAIPGATKPQVASAESLRVLLRSDSTAVEPNIAFGNLFYDTGNFGDAIPYYRRALRKDPGLVDVRVDLGVSYHNAGDLESARKELEQAIAQNPEHAVGQFDLAVVYHSIGRREDARTHYLKARALDHPPGMDAVIDTLLSRLDTPSNRGGLPPGHPDVGGAAPPP